MRSFSIPGLNLSECKLERNPWTLEGIAAMDEQLRACKSRIDPYFRKDKKRYELLTNTLDASKVLKAEVDRLYAPQFASNAWLKLIEMIVAFGLMPRAPTSEGKIVRLIDNASAPGSFLMAANYWATTIAQPPIVLDWRASTLISSDKQRVLDDTYGLQKHYPERFMTTGSEFNGDTSDHQYLRHIQKKYPAWADLYTSDYGMWVADDQYNYQEAIGAKGNLGQVLMGLIVLKPGGALVTKQFGHMSSFTLSLMAIVSGLFESLDLAKPITSKPDNSEEYLVARGYRGAPDALIEYLFRALASWTYTVKARNFAPPLVSGMCLSAPFKRAMLAATAQLVDSQCGRITANLAEYTYMVGEQVSKPRKRFVEQYITPVVAQWLQMADLRPMAPASHMKTASKAEVSQKNKERGRMET